LLSPTFRAALSDKGNGVAKLLWQLGQENNASGGALQFPEWDP